MKPAVASEKAVVARESRERVVVRRRILTAFGEEVETEWWVSGARTSD